MATRVVFMGTPQFAVPALDGLLTGGYDVVSVVTQPDRQAGRGRVLCPSPIGKLAADLGLLILQPSTASDQDFFATLIGLAPDVMVVAAYGLILPQAILDVAPHGCLNVHASLLPNYRGAAPIPAAILAGEEETGVTIMLMDAGMDTGPILNQSSCPISRRDTAETLSAKLAKIGAELLLDTLPAWLAGTVQPRQQDNERVSYAPPLRKRDGQVDWSLQAERLDRQIRAYQPWPGSVTSWEGIPLKLLEAEPIPDASVQGPHGQVVRWGDGVAVITGEGLLGLRMVQLPGKRAMTIREFVCGRRGFVGSVLTSPVADTIEGRCPR